MNNKKPVVSSPEKAKYKAMRLLMAKPRTQKELQERLLREGFTDEDTETAVSYVKSFGYINDESYASAYTAARSGEKSRCLIKRELAEKGVSSEIIESALEEDGEEETLKVYRMLLKKEGEGKQIDEKEERRLYGYFGRRGFSFSDIKKALNMYKNGMSPW